MLRLETAVCIHEEDAGILFKHTDFRDESVVVTRARKLIVQQIFTAANYEYAIQVSHPQPRYVDQVLTFGSGFSM